ncbi:hypothetical protein [Miltoncostaea oceani]|uniref:hypothetical protein n=1 Tax=Miltoncostaea oceani TaxID=2843216 RepID=UPI001C3D8B47|nr:hypothetical protein [Miltoncostaea oceani]
MATRAPGDGPSEPPRRRRRGLGWLAALVALLVIGGVAIAVVATGDDDSISGTVDSSIDAVTNAGDEARDTVTEAGDDAVENGGGAVDTATEAADEAVDAATDATDDAVDTTTDAADEATDGGSGGGSSIVEDDPVLKRLARGRELPFTVGPWARMSYRDTVYSRLRPATREYATRIRQGQGYAIQFD